MCQYQSVHACPHAAKPIGKLAHERPGASTMPHYLTSQPPPQVEMLFDKANLKPCNFQICNIFWNLEICYPLSIGILRIHGFVRIDEIGGFRVSIWINSMDFVSSTISDQILLKNVSCYGRRPTLRKLRPGWSDSFEIFFWWHPWILSMYDEI